jgi:hypothetical protein
VTDNPPAPPEILRRLRPIPTYLDHPATVGCNIAGVDPAGNQRAISVLTSEQPVLLLFLSSDCLGCLDFWEGAGALSDLLGPGVRVAIMTRDPDKEDAVAVGELANRLHGRTSNIDVIMSSGAFDDYGVAGPPFYALALGAEVRTEGVAWGVTETAKFIQDALAGLPPDQNPQSQ